MNLNDYIQNNKDRFLNELISFLKIPTISADSKYKDKVFEGAKKVKQLLSEVGVENIEIIETKGHPIVYADKIINPDLPTILVYGHYDVQPVDPLDLWDSSPFEPVIKKTNIHPQGAVFARGSSDDKGQMFAHIKAFEAMNKTNQLYCNTKFVFEGEEEVGSLNLGHFIRDNKEKLKADIILISDTGIVSNEIPSINTGLRGLSYFEVEVTGPNRDLHSGMYGGAVANPINILCKMIASLKNEKNEITIPGFYENVDTISDFEKKEIAKVPFSNKEYKSALEIEELSGEEGFSTLERVSVRPSFDVNGIFGGYTGEGAKTVLPSKAHAKISMRLVPSQTDKEIVKKFTNYFKQIAPKSVKVIVKPHHGGEAYVTPLDSKGYKAAFKAMEKSFKKKPIPLRSGGSIPIVKMFEQELGTKSILLGFGLDSDAIHSPNEHFGVFNFLKAILTISYFHRYYKELN